MSTPALKGRYLAVILPAALMFYARHKASLTEALSPEIIAALDLLVTAIPLIQAINRPGPQ